MSTPLSTLLGEYAVPLKIWLGPGARRMAADTLIDTLGHLAEVHTDPINDFSHLSGPAVLVVSADDLGSPQRENLRRLAEKAWPGRAVLIGGTSDRDVLMDAINTWRAVRVVPATAPGAEIVDAVRAAGEAMRKAVALTIAIDDLDIENTMLDSAIVQMEASRERALSAAQVSAVSMVSQGLSDAVRREQQVLEDLTNDDPSLAQAMRGVQTVADLLGQVHARSGERAAGLAATPESVDAMVAAAVELGGSGPGGAVSLDAGCQALSTIDPYALIHLLTHMIRSSRASGEVTVRCSAEDDRVLVEVRGLCPSTDAAEGPVKRSVDVLREEGAEVGEGGENGLTVYLPRAEGE